MDESIDIPEETERYILPEQSPRIDPPSAEVPIPNDNQYDGVAEKYIDGEAIDKLIREARYLRYLYHDINMSPEYRIVVQSLKDWRQILAYSKDVEAVYWLRQISRILPNRRV